MGYMDFDGLRYMDLREVVNCIPLKLKGSLQSDCTKRADVVALLANKVETAQVKKNQMEET